LVAADTGSEANAEQGAKPRRLGADDFSLRPTGSWRSPHTGGEYPSGWRLDIPSAGLSLTITPHLRDQEMNVSYAYWEGAVSVTGTMGTLPVSGNGYVELTGYAGSMQGQF
jgi:predicted secreted hydrolase